MAPETPISWIEALREMLPVNDPSTLSYLAFGVSVIFALPYFGRAVIAFLREWDDYRADR